MDKEKLTNKNKRNNHGVDHSRVINTNEGRKIKKNNRNKKVFTRGFIFFLLIISLVIIVYNIINHNYLKIAQININGNKKISDEEIIKKIENPIGRNIISYDTNKQEIKIKNINYITDVKISKDLPKIINIEVSEEFPKFIFDGQKGKVVISNKGRVMKKDSFDKSVLNSLISLKSDQIFINDGKFFSKNEKIIEFIDTMNEYSYLDLVSELNFEKDTEIGIIIKDIKVDFGNLENYNYKFKLLESILKDIEVKKIDAKSINLNNGKDPVVEINN